MIGMSNQQPFVKNTNKPDASSELWSIADEWKISGTTGLPYTAAENVFRTANDHDFYDALIQQLQGKIKESLDIGLGYYFVASYSQNGKALLYAYQDKEAADKKASYNKGVVPIGGGGDNQQQTLSTEQKSNALVKTSIIKQESPNTNIINNTKASQVVEVPYDIVMVEWDDAPSIEQVEATGMFVLPVKFTGVENWGFVNPDNGKRTFWYGRIKLVRVQEE